VSSFAVHRSHPLNPVTLTAQRQLAGACTMICWLPMLVCGVTDWPDAAALVTAGVDPGLAPALTTNTANVGVLAGTGWHWNAQPMFHWPLAIANAVLVQFPDCWVAGINTLGGPVTGVVDAAVVGVDPPADVVVVELPTAVVVVVAPPAVVVEVARDADPPAPGDALAVDELGGGSLYPPDEPELAVVPDADPVTPLNHMPNTAAMTTATNNCHVFHDRRPTICSSPGCGRRSSGAGPYEMAWGAPGAG
jgi:hypothetical protein